ncbi:SRPBCC family protein [Epibacterium ulvae]|uniref:SRPBCC family protein n=1 Tax=Epibacterium ulvae TaxID=1156985 RepID=UPI00249247BD|nr:SRPBCC family protein [Epibacterium ulvae]
MDLSTQEDVEAPIAQVFGALSDFEVVERTATRRGVDVVRRGGVGGAELGMGWDISFQLRGKDRNATLELVGYEPSTLIAIEGDGGGITGRFDIELIELSPSRTRIVVRTTLGAKTLPGRLLLQSMKLARGRIAQKYAQRISEYVELIESKLVNMA